jgi:hypothetical protein
MKPWALQMIINLSEGHADFTVRVETLKLEALWFPEKFCPPPRLNVVITLKSPI